MPSLTKRWRSFFIFPAVVLGVVLVSVVGWASNRETIKLKNQEDSYGAKYNSDGTLATGVTNWTNANPNNQVLLNFITVQSFDPISKTGPALAVELNFFPLLNLTSESAVDSAPAVPIQLIIQQKTTNYSANNVMSNQLINLDATGIPNNYPFDTYTAIIFTTASILSTNGGLPQTVFTVGAVQGFVYKTQFQGYADDGSTVAVTFNIQRSTTTQLFAAILFLLMWFISLTVFIAAMSVWFRGKKTELPLVTISTALLFALPNIRNSQPGVPSPVGTTEDMVGFFWNILLVSVSAIFLLINWILQNDRPSPTVAQTAETQRLLEKRTDSDVRSTS